MAIASLTEDKLTVIKEHQTVIKTLDAINIAHIKSLKSCLCYLYDLKVCESSGEYSRDDIFSDEFFNMIGEKVSIKQSCDEAVKRQLHNRLDTYLPKMRSLLALSKGDMNTQNMYEWIYGDKVYKYSTQIKHPFDFLYEKIPLEPITLNEAEFIERKDNERKYELCNNFYENHKQNYKEFIPRFSSCLQLFHIEKLAKKPQDHFKLSALRVKFQNYLKSKKAKLEKKTKEKYLNLITTEPLLLHFPGENYTQDEIYNILENIEKNIEIRLMRNQKYNANWFVQEDWGLRYTTLVLKNKYPNQDFSIAIDTLSKEGKRVQMAKDISLLVGSIAVYGLCNLIPTGKGIKFLGLFLGKSFCKLATSIGTANYFLIDGILKYNEAQELLLSTLKGNHLIKTPKDLLSLETQIYFASIFYPFSFRIY